MSSAMTTKPLSRSDLGLMKNSSTCRPKWAWDFLFADTEVLSWAELSSICTLQKRTQVRWSGHFVWMFGMWLYKKMFCSELAEGKRTQGGQKKKRFKDTLKASLKSSELASTPRKCKCGDEMSQKERAVTSVVKGLDRNKKGERVSEEKKTRVKLFCLGYSRWTNVRWTGR